jgi:heavy metal sensor kinase
MRLSTRSIRFRMTAWYVTVLTTCLLIFGVAIYEGLARYLTSATRSTLREEAGAIGENLLFDFDKRGPSYIVREMGEDYSPEIKDRFIRVTLEDGTELYRSGRPRDGSFAPEKIALNKIFRNGAPADESENTRILIETAWYRSPAGHRFFIENGASKEGIDKILRGLLWSLGLAFPIVVAGAAFGGYWVMRRSLASVDDITRQAQRITSRNLSERLTVIQSGDELERLSTALNHMIGRLEGAFHHINRFSADASHELRTPLTIIRGELESLVRDNDLSHEALEVLGSSLEEVERLTKIVEDLLVISRLDAGEVQLESTLVDLGSMAAATVEQLHILADEKELQLMYQSDPYVMILGDRWRLKQVIVNLVDNAIRYTRAGGVIHVRVSGDSSTAVLEVSDNGIGIAAEDLPHVFERFYTTNKSRSREMGGTGLGLPIVKAICSAHKAEIHIRSEVARGTLIRVEFPREAVRTASREPASPNTAVPKENGLTIPH